MKRFGRRHFADGGLPSRFQFTGQASYEAEFGLYFFKARWYDPRLGRFSQPDSIVPVATQGVQAFDRYIYANNNPIRYIDPIGHAAYCGDDYDPACLNLAEIRAFNQLRSHNDNNPYVLVFGGSFTTAYINRPGPDPTEQLPAWNWNPWGYEMRYIIYPGSKFDQAQKANSLGISGDTILICYSAGAEACLLYASSQFSEGNTVSAMVLIGAIFTGSDMESASDIGFDGWANYMDTALINGTDVLIVDDR